MSTIQHLFLTFSAVLGFLAVAAGAFGAHFLRARMPFEILEVFEVAVRYQMYHALALMGVIAILGWQPSLFFTISGWLFFFGVLIFSGSLYLLVFSGVRAWGAITPIGGLLLLLGWLSLALGGVFARSF